MAVNRPFVTDCASFSLQRGAALQLKSVCESNADLLEVKTKFLQHVEQQVHVLAGVLVVV